MKWTHISPLFLIALIVFMGKSMAQELRITASQGIHVVVRDSLQLILSNASLINHGKFYPGRSAVTFTGHASNSYSYIGGTEVSSFHELIINRPVAGIQLQQDISVAGALNMLSGNMDLNGHTLNLGTSGKIYGERTGALITGYLGGQITISTDLNVPTAVNPGNIGIEITSAANYGKTTIIRGHKQQPNLAAGSIHRYFEMRPSTNKDVPMQVRFNYHEAELNGINERALTLFSKVDNLNEWNNLGKDKSDLSAHWLLKHKLLPGARYTLSVGGITEQSDIKLSVDAYPNPTLRSVTISVNSDRQKQITISLLDVRGKILEVRKMNCSRGATKMTWDLDRYPVGTYLFSFANIELNILKVEKQ